MTVNNFTDSEMVEITVVYGHEEGCTGPGPATKSRNRKEIIDNNRAQCLVYILQTRQTQSGKYYRAKPNWSFLMLYIPQQAAVTPKPSWHDAEKLALASMMAHLWTKSSRNMALLKGKTRMTNMYPQYFLSKIHKRCRNDGKIMLGLTLWEGTRYKVAMTIFNPSLLLNFYCSCPAQADTGANCQYSAT